MPSDKKQWMLYGATGYTARLIIERALSEGIKPILAGRNEAKLAALAEQYQLEYQTFELSSRLTISKQLEGVSLVLNCAGPFSQTAKLMMAACLHSKVNYLDITGEIKVFQHAKQLSPSAKKAGIILCPGVGFDVVPTDCIAASLKQALPDANSLWLGFDSRSGFSPGTAKTSVEGLGEGGKIRVTGIITQVPLAYKTRNIDFGDGIKSAVTIPWGDVATAFYSTGIPNVEVYIPLSAKGISKMKRLNMLLPILSWKWVIKLMQKQVDKKVSGPSLETRKKHQTYVWGEAVNKTGKVVSARLTTNNGYDLTANASVAIIKALLSDSVQAEPGFYTPSRLMGADFVTQLPQCSEIKITHEQ